MQTFPDPRQQFDRNLKRAEETYAAWLRRGGVEPNDLLLRDSRDRALREARDACIQEINEIHHHNVKVILRDHQKRLNQIKRSSSWRRWLICLPLALLFAGLAWYNFNQPDIIAGMIYVVGALAFFAMLVLGVIVDRPRRIEP